MPSHEPSHVLLHYTHMPMQYTVILKAVKMIIIHSNLFDIMLRVALKHRLWVNVRTASVK